MEYTQILSSYNAQTLEEAEFKLKSSTKVSETSYKNCTKFPIHRTGQGSSNSPTTWCFISSVLF
jgi:Zn-finger protein